MSLIPSIKIQQPHKIPGYGISPDHLGPDKVPSLVRMQTRRITGVTPKVVQSYQGSPARFIKRSKSFEHNPASGRGGLKALMGTAGSV